MLSKGIISIEPSMFSFLYQFRKCKGCIGTVAYVEFLQESDVVLGQTSQSVSYRPRYDACRNIGVGLKMVTTLTLVVYTCIMGIEPPTKS